MGCFDIGSERRDQGMPVFLNIKHYLLVSAKMWFSRCEFLSIQTQCSLPRVARAKVLQAFPSLWSEIRMRQERLVTHVLLPQPHSSFLEWNLLYISHAKQLLNWLQTPLSWMLLPEIHWEVGYRSEMLIQNSTCCIACSMSLDKMLQCLKDHVWTYDAFSDMLDTNFSLPILSPHHHILLWNTNSQEN